MSNNPIYWKMRNGKSISIDEMDLNHLRNVLKMIVRNNQKHRKLMDISSEKSFEEIQLSGGMARDFNNPFESDEF